MSKTANLDVVKSALTNHTAYELSKFLGVSEAGIGKWKNGKVALENMSFGNAIKLTEFYGKQGMEHFDEVKNMFYDSIPSLIKREPEIAAQNIISQVEMLLTALEVKKDSAH
jgi:hypothetical protein